MTEKRILRKDIPLGTSTTAGIWVFLAYSNFEFSFEMYTDESNYQLEAFVFQ